MQKCRTDIFHVAGDTGRLFGGGGNDAWTFVCENPGVQDSAMHIGGFNDCAYAG
jgi:hypothetical protein